MASAVNSRSISSSRTDHRGHEHDDPHVPGTGSDRSDVLRPALRPLPPESLIDRLRGRLAQLSVRAGNGGVADLGHRRRGGGRGPVLDPDDVAGLGVSDEARVTARSRVLVPVLGLLAAGGLAWWLLRPPAAPLEASLPSAAPAPARTPDPRPTAEAGPGAAVAAAAPGDAVAAPTGSGGQGDSVDASAQAPLVVHASGAVASPGVYRLTAGSRVDDLIRAAGGFTPDGDVDRVNLAAPLVDGERVWVPRRGDTEVPDVVAGGAVGGGPSPSGPVASAGSGTATGGDVVIDLNRATAEELESLPGVGPATAAAILSHREQNGPFLSVDDLIEVRGIGEAKLEQIRPLVRT